MPFSSYSELKTAVLDWMTRNDADGVVSDWVALGEAWLNRKIGDVPNDISLSITSGSRVVDVSAYSFKSVDDLFIVETDDDETRLVKRSLATMPQTPETQKPIEWAYDEADDQIVTNCLSDATYSLRLVARQRFALSDSVTTNWLLEDHPDAYLAASIAYGSAYNEDDARVVSWHSMLREIIPDIRREMMAKRKSNLRVDNALLPSSLA